MNDINKYSPKLGDPKMTAKNSRRRLPGFLKWVVFIVFLFILFWPGAGRSWVEIEVQEGQSARQVFDVLKSSGLVRYRAPYVFWLRLRGASNKIQAGHYRISRGRSSFWIVDDLIQGRTLKARITIPEGFSSWQIAERLESFRLCDAEDFRKTVAEQQWEGFLFPATYEFALGMPPAKIGRIMVQDFNLRWTPEWDARSQELGLTKKQVVTLASIIQREVRFREEFPLVSAVYHNRLKKRMRLEADPTVQYALGTWKTHLTYSDYRNTKSPYNTYLNFGLPPGPICSPGLESIQAALWPADSNALFFVATEDGHHDFSATYREHTNKVNHRNRQIRSHH